MNTKEPVTFRGVCNLYFETGTEGCHWALQDERFMGIPDPTTFACKNCGRIWDKKRDKRMPKRTFATECKTAKEHNWALLNPEGVWAYEGLHVLQDGDTFTVFDNDDPSKTLWSGRVSLRQRKSYHEFVVDERIMHAVPVNVPVHEWKVWFFAEYHAELTLGPGSLASWEKWTRAAVEKKLKELGKA